MPFSQAPGQAHQTFWVLAVGILMLAITIAFLALPLFTDMIWENALGMAAIFGVVTAILLAFALTRVRGERALDRIRQTGVQGHATILSATQTGLYMNKQPQVALDLQIETPLHGSYRASTKAFVPLILMGVLTSGRPLPVKVDRTDPTKFAIEWESAGSHGSDGAPVTFSSPPAAREAIRQRLLATGLDATGTVLASVPIGETDGEGKPVFDITLFIQPPGREPSHGQARVGVPLERVAHVQPGISLPLKVDPADPAMVMVNWDLA